MTCRRGCAHCAAQASVTILTTVAGFSKETVKGLTMPFYAEGWGPGMAARPPLVLPPRGSRRLRGRGRHVLVGVPMNAFGFTRTSCACADCGAHCRFLPGMLIPADLERLAPIENGRAATIAWAKEHLLASPGALVANSLGHRFRIPTLVPARKPDGSCRNLQPDGSCGIYAVAPYGCAFFDAHMDKTEGDRRSSAALKEIASDHLDRGFYGLVWQALWDAGFRAPAPEEGRRKADGQ